MKAKELLNSITPGEWKVEFSSMRPFKINIIYGKGVDEVLTFMPYAYSTSDTFESCWERPENKSLIWLLEAIAKLPTLLRGYVEMRELLRNVTYNLEYCPHLYTEGLISEKKAKIAPIKDLLNQIEQEDM